MTRVEKEEEEEEGDGCICICSDRSDNALYTAFLMALLSTVAGFLLESVVVEGGITPAILSYIRAEQPFLDGRMHHTESSLFSSPLFESE